MLEILPALLCKDEATFLERLRLVEQQVTTVHVDILDGSMFGAMSWYDAPSIGSMNTPVSFELHLMVENPLPIVEAWKTHVPGLVRAVIHAEINRPIGAVIREIQHLDIQAGVALNPETPLEAIDHVFHTLNEVLIMGVSPGASGRTYAGVSIEEKLSQARHHAPSIVRGIDGGVTKERLPNLIASGAERFCVGSAIFASSDPASSIRELLSLTSTPSSFA